MKGEQVVIPIHLEARLFALADAATVPALPGPDRGPAMKNGRCRMHGGTARRKPTHGATRRWRLQNGVNFAKRCACYGELIDGAG